MEIVETVADLRAEVTGWQRAGERVALTPTMGGLHKGHVSLVELGRERAERVVATIFVNPTQFGRGEDFETYPRDRARDAEMLERAGAALLFAPSVDEMYPPGFATDVRVRGLPDVLCGAARPGHFDGVAQVVTKLLNQARADIAIFGEKDWQQLAVIRRLSRDLDIGTEIIGAPIVRESDGLAMSSRNRYLTETERRIAPTLFAALRKVADRVAMGSSVAHETAAAAKRLLDAGFASVDYVECRDAESLSPPASAPPERPARIFGAARLGKARLIDNLPVPTI